MKNIDRRSNYTDPVVGAVTERRNMDTKGDDSLISIKALQSAIFNSENFSSIATDANGVIQIFNVGAECMLGYTAAEVVNNITPADISDSQELIARAMALSDELATPITPGFEALVFKASRGIEDIYELTYIRKDGSRFPAVVSVTALRNRSNIIIGYLLIGTDNTARKQAEEALIKAGALQSAIFNSANFSSIATDANGVIQIFNVGAERMLGYAAADVMNKMTPADISDPKEVIARAKALSAELETPINPGFEALVFKASRGIEDIYELSYIRKDGSRFPAVVSVTALRNSTNVIIGYLLIGTDNTARKQAEDALIKAGALQSAIFNSANFSSIATDANGVIQIFNVGAERMLGYAASDVMNKMTPADISDPNEVIARAKALSIELDTPINPGFEALVFKASRGIEDIYELTYIRKDGSWFPAVVSVTALRDSAGSIIGYLLIGTDNTARKLIEEEQKKLDQRLRDQQFYTRSLIESNIDAIMTSDPKGIITDVNRQMEALTDRTREELIGAPMNRFFTEPERALEMMRSVLRDKKVTDYDLTVLSRDGKNTSVSYNATTFYDRERVLQGVFAAARDVTESKRLDQVLLEKNSELQNARLVADRANLAKSDFLSNMSHEIRTPMNGIVGMVDILQTTALNPSQRGMLNTVHKSSLSLLNILNDILDYSKIESGMLAVESIPMHLREVTESVVQLMAVAASAARVELFVSIAPDLPAWIFSDPTRMRQVLLNLVGNAIKFSKVRNDGSVARVSLWVESYPLEQEGRGLQIRVEDNGIGMGPQLLTDLFQPFVQADASTARRFGGTGLGLSISQRLVTLMGGQIHVKSTLGSGSEFSITLPLQVAQPALAYLPVTPLDGVQIVILIADANLRQIVQTYATEAQASVLILADLSELQQLPPVSSAVGTRVLILGWEHVLHASDLPGDMGLVRLSQFDAPLLSDGELVIAGLPLIYSDLIHALSLASHRIMPDTMPVELVAQVNRVPSIEEAMLQRRLILLADDNEVNRTVIQHQLRLLGYASETAEDGQLALAMWSTGRYAMLLTDCHMPNMDGFDLTQAIRKAEPVGTRLPIIAITANAMQGEALRCIAHGMDEYLAKPMRMQELAPVLHKWLPVSASGAGAIVPERTHNLAPIANLPVWDKETLYQIVGEDATMQEQLLKVFLLNAESLSRLIFQSAILGKVRETASQAHSLKSAARMVGALKMGALCEEIESAGLENNVPACRNLADGLETQLAQVRESIGRDF